MSRDRLRTPLCAAGALAGALALGGPWPATAVAIPPEVRHELRAAEAPIGTLVLDDRVAIGGDAAVYRFGQERAGIPVDGSEAIVLDTAGEGAELVADETAAGIAAAGEPRLTARRAIEVALDAAGATALAARPEAEQVIAPEDEGVPAWRVSVPSARPLGDFEVLVDAASGAVLEQRDLTWRASGRARLFLPNPVVGNGGYRNPPGQFDLCPPSSCEGADRGDRDTAELTSLRSPVTLERMNASEPCLRGRYAEVRVGRRERRVCRQSRAWDDVTRGSYRFEALMAYHHIDQAQEYLTDVLGAPGVDDKRQLVIANAFSADNSFYLAGSDIVKLGAGGVDDGEDGDVIVHELGHAVQDTQRPGFGDGAQAGAIGEGWGDYFAAAVSEELWGTSGEFSACVMEWDATSYDEDTASSPGICLRRTDTKRTLSEQRAFCPGRGRNEIHCVGEAWSGALWELRGQIDEPASPSVVDVLVVNSHPMLPRAATFEQAARALLRADDVLYPAGTQGDGTGQHCQMIRGELVARGFLSSSYACG